MAATGGRIVPARSSAAKGFFTLFYDWSVSCSSPAPRRSLHIVSRRVASSHRHPRPVQLRSQSSAATNTSSLSSGSSAEPVLSSHLRTLMRTIPHSVVVCTSTSPTVEKGTLPKYRGMTLSSFTTLTLTPDPIITFNIKKPSSTLDAIRASKEFHVHILSASKSGARVADAFTKGNADGVWRSKDFTVLKRGREDVGPPLLSAEGIVRVLRCQVLTDQEGLVEVGDHVLVLGMVKGIMVPPGSGEVTIPALGYADGRYRGLGEVLQLE